MMHSFISNGEIFIYTLIILLYLIIIFNYRFLTIFERKDLIIASCLHPKFKFNWLTGERRKFAENCLEELLGIQSNEIVPNYDKNADDHDDFFDFHQRMNPAKRNCNNF